MTVCNEIVQASGFYSCFRYDDLLPVLRTMQIPLKRRTVPVTPAGSHQMADALQSGQAR